jgi:choline/glycine/proline betaine transport protein
VAEPVVYYDTYVHRYSSGDDNQRSIDAIAITSFHWGLHAFCVYCLDGLLLALVAFKLGLPMNERSCL